MTRKSHSISPLRQRMIDDMTMRKLSLKTQGTYIRVVKNFTHFLGRSPDTASAEDLRRYQLHIVSTGVSGITINATITGFRFLFEVTLERLERLKCACVHSCTFLLWRYQWTRIHAFGHAHHGSLWPWALSL